MVVNRRRINRSKARYLIPGIIIPILVIAGFIAYRVKATAAPVTIVHITPSTPDGEKGWYKTKPTISFSATPPSTIQYRIDSGPTQTYGAPVQIPDGSRTISFQSVDQSGVFESLKTVSIKQDTVGPAAPVVQSKSCPDRESWYPSGNFSFSWTATDSFSGVKGYSFVLDKSPATKPDEVSEGASSSKTYKGKNSGTWHFHIRSQDNAGNWGPASHFRVRIDSFKPVANVTVKGFTLNTPGTVIKFKLIEAVPVKVEVSLAIKRNGNLVKTLFGNKPLIAKNGDGASYCAKWDGIDNWYLPVNAGIYVAELRLVDPAGNRSVSRARFTISNEFSLQNAKSQIYGLSSSIGVRSGGSTGEHKAADYIEKQLRKYGYAVTRQSFPIPGNRTSYNVIAQKNGKSSSKKIILGAHYDTKNPSPGANDNASGCGILLELARISQKQDFNSGIAFAFFGTEEIAGSTPREHHYGSHFYVNAMTPEEKRQTLGMISVDMVGYGSAFNVRSMQKGTMALVNALLKYARPNRYSLSFLRDPGAYGWSDHEGFELAGIPAAWLEWREDPAYHTAKDSYDHVQWDRIGTTGKFLWGFLKEKYGSR